MRGGPRAPENPYRPVWASINDVRPETETSVTLRVQAKSRSELDRFRPGQFAMLYVFGVGEAAISCCYDEADTDHLNFTVRSAGAISNALTQLKPGDMVGIRGPFGQGWPMDGVDGCDLVLMAGGVGLAPIRPVLHAVLEQQVQPVRTQLMYGARDPGDILYANKLPDWAQLGIDIQTIVDRSDAKWSGQVGLVTSLVTQADFEPKNTIAFLCGPEVMMRFSAYALVDRGVSSDRIWLSMERNMKCAIGHCGHCQFGKDFICRDGPVLRFDQIQSQLVTREI
ncbi:MAG: FAD/NAD(P)-binding protein [Henriciella sp.]|nr:FAD/NAD(P)-binding protein [Henriciella sp.]